MRSLVVLGATGPIGSRALQASVEGGLDVVTIVDVAPSPGLLRSASEHPAARVVVLGATARERRESASRGGDRIGFGVEEMRAAATAPGRTIVNGLPGVSGLVVVAAALDAGNRVVVTPDLLARSGSLLPDAARRGGGDLVVTGVAWSVTRARADGTVGSPRRLTIVGDGGPLRGIGAVEAERMGPDVLATARAIDAATLLDVATEVIGACTLLDTADVDVGIGPEGAPDAIVETGDGSLLAHATTTDDVAAFVVDPDRAAGALTRIDERPELDAPGAIGAAVVAAGFEAVHRGGTALAAFGAAREVAVRAFLERRIGLTTIPEVLTRTIESTIPIPVDAGADVEAADREAREMAMSLLGGTC